MSERKPIPPMSPEARAVTKERLAQRVKTPEFQRKLERVRQEIRALLDERTH